MKKTKKPVHRWQFKKHIKPNTYSWKSSPLVCKRLKEALSEIKACGKKDRRAAAYGIIELAESIWPALEHVDSSSGALESTVYGVLKDCAPIFAAADLEDPERDELLDRLYKAVQDDGVDYLMALSESWGELCGSRALASKWADMLSPSLERYWREIESDLTFQGPQHASQRF